MLLLTHGFQCHHHRQLEGEKGTVSGWARPESSTWCFLSHSISQSPVTWLHQLQGTRKMELSYVPGRRGFVGNSWWSLPQWWGEELEHGESELLLKLSLKALCLLASDHLTVFVFFHFLIPSCRCTLVSLDYLSQLYIPYFDQSPPTLSSTTSHTLINPLRLFPQLHPILWSIPSDSQHDRPFAGPAQSVWRKESSPAGHLG